MGNDHFISKVSQYSIHTRFILPCKNIHKLLKISTYMLFIFLTKLYSGHHIATSAVTLSNFVDVDAKPSNFTDEDATCTLCFPKKNQNSRFIKKKN